MPSPTKTKAPGRGKSDPRMSFMKWARENGAVHIKVDGMEAVFPHSFSPDVSQASLSPEDVVRRGSPGSEFNANAPDAITSEHPDEYANNSDRWANLGPYLAQG